MAEIVYRSASPLVLASIEDWRADMNDWHKRSTALLVELGFTDQRFVVATSFGSRWITGVEIKPDRTTPDGWRVAHRSGMDVLIPDKRRKAGRQAWSRIEDCKPPIDVRQRLLGMPGEHWVGNRIISPEMRMISGTVWLRWMCESLPGVNLDLWEQARLSQYWAAREADEQVAES